MFTVETGKRYAKLFRSKNTTRNLRATTPVVNHPTENRLPLENGCAHPRGADERV
jgi:hypothetical protein